ncbi:hypothetical protein [Nocardia xishanensis]
MGPRFVAQTDRRRRKGRARVRGGARPRGHVPDESVAPAHVSGCPPVRPRTGGQHAAPNRRDAAHKSFARPALRPAARGGRGTARPLRVRGARGALLVQALTRTDFRLISVSSAGTGDTGRVEVRAELTGDRRDDRQMESAVSTIGLEPSVTGQLRNLGLRNAASAGAARSPPRRRAGLTGQDDSSSTSWASRSRSPRRARERSRWAGTKR